MFIHSNVEEFYMLRYFYGISVDIVEKDDFSKTDTGDEFVNLFNLSLRKCEKYSPFAKSSGMFGESCIDTEVFKIYHQLFCDCIINSLLTAKQLAFTSGEVELSDLHKEDMIKFVPTNANYLINGYFTIRKYNEKMPHYSIDSIYWQQKKARINKYIVEKESYFYNMVYGSVISKATDHPKLQIQFPSYNADFYTCLAFNEGINELMQMLDVRISKINTNQKLSSALCQKLNNRISASFNNPLHINFHKELQPYLDKYEDHINHVDSLLLSYQLENLFHAPLYIYLLDLSTKRILDKLVTNYHFTNIEKPYEQFVNSSLDAHMLPSDTLAISVLEYGLRHLTDFAMYEQRKTYIDNLRTPLQATSLVLPPNNDADHTFSTWQLRLKNMIHLLSELYIPLLEKTFFLMLIKAYGGTETQWKNLVDKLYEYISAHIDYLHTNTYCLPERSPYKEPQDKLIPFPANYGQYIKPPAKKPSRPTLDINPNLTSNILKQFFIDKKASNSSISSLQKTANELLLFSPSKAENNNFVTLSADKHLSNILDYVTSYR